MERAANERNKCGARIGSVSQGSGTGKRTARWPLPRRERTSLIHYPPGRIDTLVSPRRAYRQLIPCSSSMALQSAMSTTPALSSSPCSWRPLISTSIHSRVTRTKRKGLVRRELAFANDGALLRTRSSLLLVTTRRRLRRPSGSGGVHIHIYIRIRICIRVRVRVALFVVAFAFFHRRAPPRPAWPLVFGRCCLADVHDPVVSDSPPVLAAGGTFAIGSAVRVVARAVHPHSAVCPGTRATARKNLHPREFRRRASQCAKKSLLRSFLFVVVERWNRH